jgi:exodeoxyribonuclease VII small subunit
MQDQEKAKPSADNKLQSDAASGDKFEALIEELDTIVGRLENGELSLEESLSAFERGMVVSKKASSILDAAERRIEVLSGSPEAPETQPFE